MNSKKNHDILVVGELNVDLILDRLNKAPEFGKEQRADAMTLTLGSSSAIFAANCSSLGASVAFCGKVGQDSFGDYVMHSLAAKGVNSDSVLTDEELKTGATIIFHYGNDRMMVTHPGAMSHMTVGDVPDDLIQKCRHLHTSAIFFQPGIKKDMVDLFKRAREYGLTTSMDTQWDPEEKWDLNLNQLLPVLDFFLPNEGELLRLTGTSDIQDALGKLSGFNTAIVVKRGEKGAIMQKNNKQRSVPAYKIPEFTDAVGAGDSFNAGFIHAFLNGKDLAECLSFGNLTAAVSTTKAGGTDGIVSYEDVLKQKKKFEQTTQ